MSTVTSDFPRICVDFFSPRHDQHHAKARYSLDMHGAVTCARINACTRVGRRERQRYSAICAATAAMLRRMYVGGVGREGGMGKCIYMGKGCRRRGRSPVHVVNLLSLYFRNWRTSCAHSFDFQPSSCASRRNFAFFPLFLFFLRNFYLDYYRNHLRANIVRDCSSSQ